MKNVELPNVRVNKRIKVIIKQKAELQYYKTWGSHLQTFESKVKI